VRNTAFDRDHVRFPGFLQAGGEMSAFVDKGKRG